MTLKSCGKVVSNLMLKHKLTISIAESCTGGLISKQLTDNPGSSNFIVGGVVAYSNEIKNKLEQLRALDNGLKINAALAKSSPIGVDTEEDFVAIKKIMEYKVK